ncbi:protein rhomboid isoform X2 [Lucilia sericata]|uniref:protein rhomboid isoform X2 n=1 Tax=Lucilia sericata TaxID=13632 RepID=UPI0018A870E1|nr:protein rhomboid isoform X2 [Lucilia sericata]
MINSLIVNNEINKEDLNRNLLFRIENSCEITSACDKCNMNTETNSNLLSDHEQIERKDFIDDLEYNKRIWKVPWFILIMCFLQISLYCIANACMRQQLMFMPETINDYWRYFTYMLLHSDVLHLSMNVCLQPQLSLMGASAGVYAMLMSHIPHLLKNFHNLPQRYLRILSMVILFISDMCFTTFHVLINHNTNPRICLEAHAAGAISGLVFGFLIYKTNSKKSTFVGGRLKTLPRGRDDQHV